MFHVDMYVGIRMDSQEPRRSSYIPAMFFHKYQKIYSLNTKGIWVGFMQQN